MVTDNGFIALLVVIVLSIATALFYIVGFWGAVVYVIVVPTAVVAILMLRGWALGRYHSSKW